MRTKVRPKTRVKKVYDDLDAVRDIVAVLESLAPESVDRVMRWVREKFGLDDASLPGQVRSQVILPSQASAPKRVLRNPHEMNSPPLNKIIVQDDDEFGELLGIPADRDVPEPPNADILKPVKETRRFVAVVDEHKGKDGKVMKSTSIVAR